MQNFIWINVRMGKKLSFSERKGYVLDKLKQINETPQTLSQVCFISLDRIDEFLTGRKNIEDKEWVQIGLGLLRLAKQKGICTEQEEKRDKVPPVKRVSRTAIIRKVESIDVFKS